MAGAAIMWQLNAIAQGRIQQQLTTAGHKAAAIDGYLMMFRH
jgi:hypothetical protein